MYNEKKEWIQKVGDQNYRPLKKIFIFIPEFSNI